MAEYVIEVYSSAGVRQATVTDYIGTLDVGLVCNGVDVVRFTVNATSSYASYLVNGAIIEVYREDIYAGIAMYRAFAGTVQTTATAISDTTVIEVTALGMNFLASTRIVAYPAGVTNRAQFTAQASETIMKTLWNYNVGSLATTANGRYLDGRITGATTSATTGAGTVQSISVAGLNLLNALQNVQKNAGGDFAVIYTAPATWAFTWYTGQLGTDRSASVIFSVSNGTVGQMTLSSDNVNSASAAIVAGQGEGSARVVVTRPASLPTGLALKEVWVDARNQKTVAEYQNLGTATLAQIVRDVSTVSVSVIQSNALRYGRDYFLGDIVTVDTGAGTVTRKIDAVSMKYSREGKEVVDVGLIAL
jgi:hypothetical protein